MVNLQSGLRVHNRFCHVSFHTYIHRTPSMRTSIGMTHGDFLITHTGRVADELNLK